jgi:hypothetical protein
LDKDYGFGSTRHLEGAQQVKTLKQVKILFEAAAVASSVILGKAGYLLQLAQFPLHRLQKWDSALDGALLCKAGSSLGASPAMIHASRKEGGLGVFSFAALALQCGATELLVGSMAQVLGGKWPAVDTMRH